MPRELMESDTPSKNYEEGERVSDEEEATKGMDVRAWASFVWELRRHGYWGDPEEFREYFRGFYSKYLEGEKDDHVWEDSHCCDGLEGDNFVYERCWMFWTEEDRKKVEEENRRLLREETLVKMICAKCGTVITFSTDEDYAVCSECGFRSKIVEEWEEE